MPEPLAGNPLELVQGWLADAEVAGLPLPSTMTLATVGDGDPHARTVVVTSVTDHGLTFHTSTPTTKSRDLRARPQAAGVFHWPALGRQVVLEGGVTELSAEASSAAFPTRPRQLQLLAWVYDDLAGEPEHVTSHRAQERMSAAATRDPGTLGMPPSWTTFRLLPRRVDFWQAGTEEVAPTKTRFSRSESGWVRSEALP